MTFFFGGGTIKAKPAYTGLQLQTASSALGVPIIYGINRIAPNLIWYGAFKAIKHKQKTGKGGGPKVESYTYSASVQMALCEGPIEGVDVAWKDQEETTLTALGFTLFPGTDPQLPWSYLTTNFPDAALNYNGTAYIAQANYDLGDNPQLGNHTFEVKGIFYDTDYTSLLGADPALIIPDFLTNTQYGAYFPEDYLDMDTILSSPDAPTTGDSAYQTYCRTQGFSLSPIVQDPKPALQYLEQWTLLTNTAIFWSGGKIKFVPWAEENITANGVTYIAPTQVRYVLTDDDFIYEEGTDPVTTERTDPADGYNSVTLVINDSAFDYNEKPIEVRDQAAIEAFGVKPYQQLNTPEITDATLGAKMAGLVLQRKGGIRQYYKFKLDHRYILLEPMDVVELDTEGLEGTQVRILEKEEDEEGRFVFLGEEFQMGTARTTDYVPTPSEGYIPNTNQDPGPVNPPIIFMPPADLTNGNPEIWLAVSGGNGTVEGEYWGGCQVLVSTDNINYVQVGTIENPARQGVLSAPLASFGGTNPDTATLSVNLTMSESTLDSGSAGDAAAGRTLCYVDGELIGYEDSTLVSQWNYDLDPLWRGLYGSTIGSHASGTQFARLDEAIFKFDLPEQYLGQTLYFKFPSFNIWGTNLEDVSTVSAYTFTPTGVAPEPPASVTATGDYRAVKVSVVASPTAGVSEYKVYAVNNHTGAFGTATVVGRIAAGTTVFTHTPLDPGALWRYWATAVNVFGESTEVGPADATVLAQDGITGVAFQEEGVAVVTSPTLNVVGAGATVTDVAGVATLTIPGGGGSGSLPTGGVAGQVLTKLSSTDYDADWETPAVGTDNRVVRELYGAMSFSGVTSAEQSVGWSISSTGSLGVLARAANRLASSSHSDRATSAAINSQAGVGQFQTFLTTWDWTIRFTGGLSTSASGRNIFVGARFDNAFPGNTQPINFTNCVGFCVEAADTTWHVLHNDNTGTATKTNTGISFNNNDVVFAEVENDAAGGTMTVRFKRWLSTNFGLTPDDTYSLTILSDLPQNSVYIGPQAWVNTNTSTTAARVSLIRWTWLNPF